MFLSQTYGDHYSQLISVISGTETLKNEIETKYEKFEERCFMAILNYCYNNCSELLQNSRSILKETDDSIL